jgi:predicted aconitase/predicted aconitase with swiveling domain
VTKDPERRDAPLQVADGEGRGEVLVCAEGLSFWGGVDPATGRIIDAHHPNRGDSVASKILLMPTSRGSCSGSGVLLELALNGLAPAALVFREPEEILTLGALVSDRVFGRPVPVLRLPRTDYEALARAETATLSEGRIVGDGVAIDLERPDPELPGLSDRDRALLAGEAGPAAKTAMEILLRMAAAEGASRLVDVARGHVDGCILAHSANLIFAERMAEAGARVAIPTTINAISVDRADWRLHGVAEDFGERAIRLADAYVRMGARPTFTCAPYLLDDAPKRGELIGWSESNAVVYANSVLGARTAKHPDHLDLFVAITGRAPLSAVHTDAGRAPRRVLELAPPGGEPDDAFWPLVGWLAGRLSPDRIPLITGLDGLGPTEDDLKGLCAAFGVTSGAPMLHVAGVSPEADLTPEPDCDRVRFGEKELLDAWRALNDDDDRVDLVAIGSPHASSSELRRLADLMDGRDRRPDVEVMVTLGRDVLRRTRSDGTAARLERAGVRLMCDLCWCSITEPVLPADARVVMTNSAKYAHYAQGLTGRRVRFAGLGACVEAAITGVAPSRPPAWLRSGVE